VGRERGPAVHPLARPTRDCGALIRGEGCGRLDCTSPVCRARVACRRARALQRAWERADRETGRRVPLYVVTLTLPANCRQRVATPDAAQALARAAWQVAAGWLRGACGIPHGAALAGRAVLHQPDGAPHVMVVGSVGGRALPRRLRGNLGELRARWGKVLAGLLGWAGEPGSLVVRPEVARNRLRAARYSLRSQPGWSRAATRPVAHRAAAYLDRGTIRAPQADLEPRNKPGFIPAVLRDLWAELSFQERGIR